MFLRLISSVSAMATIAFFASPSFSQTANPPLPTTLRTSEIIEAGGPGIGSGAGFGTRVHIERTPFGGTPVMTYSVPSIRAEASKDLPVEVQSLVNEHTRESDVIRKRANCEIRKLRVSLRQRLKDLQDKYTREAKLDEAVAIRDQIRALQIPPEVLITDPIPLWDGSNRVGQVFFFRVTGSIDGSVWGSDIYTADSTVASVAVHAGVLKPGQTGVVKVTVLLGQTAYTGSTRNGVIGHAYGAYPASIKVEAPFDESECDLASDSSTIKSESPAADTSQPHKNKRTNRQHKRKKTN